MNKLKCLNGNTLKMIAVITMLIDHIGVAIMETGFLSQRGLTGDEWDFYYGIDNILRLIGRISFPIFCFLLVEGFIHTRDVKKYGGRLLLFAFVSEIPFDLAVFGTWMNMGYQNIYFTLFLGLMAMAGIEKWKTNPWKQAGVVVAGFGLSMLLKTDYDAFGVFLILLIYILRNHPLMQTVLGCLALASIEPLWAGLAFIPIRMYDGTRGTWNLKYVFYAFYPVHLLLLWLIRIVIL